MTTSQQAVINIAFASRNQHYQTMNNEKREQQMMAAADAYVEESEEIYNIVEAITDFCAGWRAADQHPQWIPVEEELPKEEDLYIVSNGKRTSVAYWVEDEWDSFGDVITHWMPLPQAPKEE